jgi:formylglycine-generating enzyme required for sulfatase activity
MNRQGTKQEDETMDQCFLAYVKRISLLMIAQVILIGCAATSSAQPTVLPIQANLTAVATPVQLSRAANPAAALQQDETVSIQPNDAIAVPESGHGVIRLGDRVVVDVLRGTEFSLADVKPEPGDSLFVKLQQVAGHTRVALSENANARVRLETGFASVTTLRAGTEFLICHDPAELTCLVVLTGEVEVVGQGKLVTVRGGEGTYILKDKPPFPPICARMDEVNAWLDKKLGTGDIQPLGELVAGWKQESCAAATQTSPGADSTTQPQVLPQPDEMVKIEAGVYTVGSTASDEFHISPQQKELPAFWIDRYEVTNAQYQKFMNETGHPQPRSWPGGEKHPVRGASWDEAAAYCAWAHKRLPTEAEWEAAARGSGPNPPLFPWGDDPGAGGKISDLPRTDTYEIGAFEFNKSPSGVYDMAGNVWQWVSEPYYPVPEGYKILRGGRYGLIQDMAYRQPAEPNSERFVPFAGFRCAADQVQGE